MTYDKDITRIKSVTSDMGHGVVWILQLCVKN